MHSFQVRGQIVLITRSRGSQCEYESRELGEARWRRGVLGGVMKKGEQIGSQGLCECAATKS